MKEFFIGIKLQLPKFFAAALGLLSVATAHYLGFLHDVPLQMMGTIGGNFIANVTSRFFAYVVACIVMARFFSYILSAIYIIVLTTIERVHQFQKLYFARPFRRKYRVVRAHRAWLRSEQWVTLFIQFFIFINLMLEFYLNFKLGAVSIFSTVIFVVLFFATIIRAELFLIPISLYIRRMRNSARINFRRKVFLSTLVGFSSITVFLGYFSGEMRFDYLESLPASSFTNSYYSGRVHILANSGSSILLSESVGKYRRYLFITENFGVADESANIPEDVFKKLGN